MTTKLHGFAELDKALAELGKSTERTLLRRVGLKVMEQVRDRARDLVPVDTGITRESIVVSTQLNRSARRAERREPKNGVRIYVGTANRNAVPREYGTRRQAATPFMRPAFAETGDAVIRDLGRMLGPEIEQTAARAAKRRARSAARSVPE